MPDVEVKIYSSDLCGYCRAAKRLLQSKGLEFNEINVDGEPEVREQMIRESGRKTVPQIWLGNQHIGGYTDLAELDQSGELDQMLAGQSNT